MRASSARKTKISQETFVIYVQYVIIIISYLCNFGKWRPILLTNYLHKLRPKKPIEDLPNGVRSSFVHPILLDSNLGLSNCLLCTFLSLSTEKYQKNATKGLGALWTPVLPIWVCLTEDIHGGGFEKRSANVCGDAFLTPRQTQPQADARP